MNYIKMHEAGKFMSIVNRGNILFVLLIWFAQGCSGYHVRPDISAKDRLALAKKMYENKDYFEAKQQFKIVTLNNPGASFVDEAQFYLAESHFHSKEYILAADEYNRLVRVYPKSKWVDDAQFKVGVCDFKLSPKPSLDQTYTERAVQNLQSFIEEFPDSDLMPEAERLLSVCRAKLSEKDFKAGRLYRKMGDYYAASVYFESVTTNYYDTEYAEDAYYWDAECLYRLDKIAEARSGFEELLRKFPKTRHSLKAKERLETIADALADSGEENKRSASNGRAGN